MKKGNRLTINKIEQQCEYEKDTDDLTNKYSVELFVPGNLPKFVCNVSNTIYDENGEIKDVKTSKWKPDRMLFNKHNALYIKDILDKKFNGIATIKIIKEK